ncbi:toll/interleukin-1 receptor domain-containing protein [Methanobacterium alcaliphilum]|uniref:toll/interleukin-1 receptor domain-containing protein n=1 Tax=Methanobacterium alcaliphilum TaxID=392018 RepID=UPI00200A06AC|nr:tetratricopeptide repeat protein [Methanobacterium alcaliphilum]MCK9151545.1 TIR domain-containing protein [Methanobacterium alcaliphilum]
MAYDVFISYETDSGKDYAEHLKHALEKSKIHKFNVFVAHVNLSSGNDWRKEIDDALEKSVFFIVIITSLTIESDEVKNECKRALELNKRIISLKHSRVSLSEIGKLAKFQQCEFKNDSELVNEAIFAIKNDIKKEKEKIKIKDDPEEFWQRGNLFYNLKQMDKALNAYNKAIKLKPDHVGALVNKGLVLLNLSKPLAALKCFNMAMDVSPTADVYSNKGLALTLLNESDAAIVCYNEALK